MNSANSQDSPAAVPQPETGFIVWYAPDNPDYIPYFCGPGLDGDIYEESFPARWAASVRGNESLYTVLPFVPERQPRRMLDLEWMLKATAQYESEIHKHLKVLQAYADYVEECIRLNKMPESLSDFGARALDRKLKGEAK